MKSDDGNENKSMTMFIRNKQDASVPGAALIMLTMVLSSVGLPLDGIALVAGVDRVLDMARTTSNVTGDASAAVIVANSEGELTLPSNTLSC